MSSTKTVLSVATQEEAYIPSDLTEDIFQKTFLSLKLDLLISHDYFIKTRENYSCIIRENFKFCVGKTERRPPCWPKCSKITEMDQLQQHHSLFALFNHLLQDVQLPSCTKYSRGVL